MNNFDSLYDICSLENVKSDGPPALVQGGGIPIMSLAGLQWILTKFIHIQQAQRKKEQFR